MHIVVTPEPFNEQAELAAFAQSRTESAGALASFAGYCRGQASGAAVESLQLDHYPGFTEAEIERVAQTVFARHNLDDLLIVHRAGRVFACEPIVLVAAMSAHRSSAFAAVTELMDYLKTDAPFWKREFSDGESRWIEPTDGDRTRRAARGD